MKISRDCLLYIKLSLLVQASFVIACEAEYFAVFTTNARVLSFLHKGSCFLIVSYLLAILLGFLFKEGDSHE